MNQSIATRPATTTLRQFCVRLWKDPDSRSTTIGLGAVILFHLLLWLVGPLLLRFDDVALAPRPHTSAREFNIEIAPDTFAKAPPKPKDPSRFVEANPEAPENTPDKTNNFAAQNQQVAQEKPTPDGKSDMPATTGKKDFESNQIVSGRLSQPIEHVEAQPPPSALPEAEQKILPPKAEQNPLSGSEKFEGENKEDVGSNFAKRLENTRAIPEKIEGVKGAKEFEGATAMQPAIDPKRPRARPQVVKAQQVRPAILADRAFGTTNIGNIAVDARWSNYGAYLQRMIDTVQIQWERLILQQSANPIVGSTVTVKFVMNDEGRITMIVNVDSTANETASRACVSAITDRAPYGTWTDDMKAMLGAQQEMTFTFYYQ
ncbi:MAG: hypothetical protein EXS37_21160 [Opitutus sp.]|nr:hypothetical protein [Opitutus sp.]